MPQIKKVLHVIPVIMAIALASCQGTRNDDSSHDENPDVITFSGEKTLLADYVVNENELLEIREGTTIRLGNNVRIIVRGKIIARGTEKAPVSFTSVNDTLWWRGIEIQDLEDIPETDRYAGWLEYGNKETGDGFFASIKEGNVFDYCVFENAIPESRSFERKNKWMAVIEAYNTSLRVSNCVFRKIYYYGGVLTQRSLVVVDNCTFDDEDIHKAINSTDRSVGIFYNNTIVGHRSVNARCADGIWMKKSVALIANNDISTVADDGIDTDQSRVVVFRNVVKSVLDDGIDIDNGGYGFLIENDIEGVAENGILVSDGSEIIANRNRVKASASGLILRDGAEVVSEGLQISENGIGISLYQNIPVAMTSSDYRVVKEKIGEMPMDVIFDEEFIDGVETHDDIYDLLDEYYEDRGDYRIFKKEKFENVSKLDPLKKVFKLAGILDFEEFQNSETRLHPLSMKTKNGLYLSGAEVKSNKEDVALYHDYNLKIEHTSFTDEETEKGILENCRCDENHRCEIIDKLNTSGVESNAVKIIRRIDREYSPF